MRDNKPNFEELRKKYQLASLDIEQTGNDPLVFFETWFSEALDSNINEPNAFTLATVDQGGNADARVVLLKGIKNGAFAFYTNYESSKGQQLASNNSCAMVFLWLELERQVRIRGHVRKMSIQDSKQYFAKRPKGSQIGALTSPQSQTISKEELVEKRDILTEKYRSSETIPMPEHWGGYLIEPVAIEFWQGRDNRLHDRILFEKNLDSWNKRRIAP